MREILSTIMIVLTISWCIYGLVVFWRWEKVAKKADKMLDEQEKWSAEPRPLALRELQQMVGEPVWAVYNGVGRWCIVNDGLLSITGNYGEEGYLIAYRRKPEGGEG